MLTSYANRMLLFVLVCIEKSSRNILLNFSSQQKVRKVHHVGLERFLPVNPTSLWCFLFSVSLFSSLSLPLSNAFCYGCDGSLSVSEALGVCVCVCELKYRHVQSNIYCSFMDYQRSQHTGFLNSWKTGLINEGRKINNKKKICPFGCNDFFY